MVIDSINQACAKNQDSSTAAESDSYQDLEIHLFDYYSTSFNQMDDLIDIRELIPKSKFVVQQEANKADIIKDMNFYRSVYVSRQGKTLVNGFLICGLQQKTKPCQNEEVNRQAQKELFGLICNIMIDPKVFGTHEGDKALIALIKSLEALAWLFMCQQICIIKN